MFDVAHLIISILQWLHNLGFKDIHCSSLVNHLFIHSLSAFVCSVYNRLFTCYVCHFASEEDSARIES